MGTSQIDSNQVNRLEEMNIAIIPARSGSKRIKGKNIKPFNGMPMIAYSVIAAIQSEIFDRVVVSTDSEIIAEIARSYGAEIPFLRPPEIADDFTPTAPVVEHAIKMLENENKTIERVCCLYATAPFVKPKYIIEGYKLIKERKVSSVFSVTTFPFSIFRALKRNEKGRLEMIWPEHELTRSNDLPETYHDAGQFYWLDSEVFLKKKKMYGKDALPVVLPRYLVQDIDTPEDWVAAELMHKIIRERCA